MLVTTTHVGTFCSLLFFPLSSSLPLCYMNICSPMRSGKQRGWSGASPKYSIECHATLFSKVLKSDNRISSINKIKKKGSIWFYHSFSFPLLLYVKADVVQSAGMMLLLDCTNAICRINIKHRGSFKCPICHKHLISPGSETRELAPGCTWAYFAAALQFRLMLRLPSMDRSDAAPAGVVYCEQTVLRGCIYRQICMMGSRLNAWRTALLKKRRHCCIYFFFILCPFKRLFPWKCFVCSSLFALWANITTQSLNQKIKFSFLSVSFSFYFGKQQTKDPRRLRVTLPVINGVHLLNAAAIPMGDCIETSGYRCIDLFEDNEVCLNGLPSPCCHGDGAVCTRGL